MEFGSDFHSIVGYAGEPLEIQSYNPVYFADGRMAIQHLLQCNKWSRIWVPKYFCYEVIDAIRESGVEVVFYPDFPGADDQEIINNIVFGVNDVLLRMNFFGMRSWRDSSQIPVSVIEDHSHGLHTEWARKSNADYCIASLRKTLPVPEGGIAWSPKQNRILLPPESSLDNDVISVNRHYGMYRKRMYLLNYDYDKDAFRRILLETEDKLGNLKICSISNLSKYVFDNIDALAFDNTKKDNWSKIKSLLCPEIDILHPDNDGCLPFSMVLRFNSDEERAQIRSNLISKAVYPAVLWPIPDDAFVRNTSKYLLSVHCDARYNNLDMYLLAHTINHACSNK